MLGELLSSHLLRSFSPTVVNSKKGPTQQVTHVGHPPRHSTQLVHVRSLINVSSLPHCLPPPKECMAMEKETFFPSFLNSLYRWWNTLVFIYWTSLAFLNTPHLFIAKLYSVKEFFICVCGRNWCAVFFHTWYLSGLGIRVTLASENELKSILYFSIFL